MRGIYETNSLFNFNNLIFLTPTVISGGNYFIKFRINDGPLYIQPPKCKTKQSIIKTGKRMHCDLMFNNENEDFIKWMEDLEYYSQKKIFENREKWFETELDEHDIENSFTSPLKLFKSGKYYICRTFIPTVMGLCSLKIYNENETVVPLENIQENSDVMTILEIHGIKCSAKNFQIDVELKQMMVLNPVNLFERCIFKHKEPEIENDPKYTPPISTQIVGLIEDSSFTNSDTVPKTESSFPYEKYDDDPHFTNSNKNQPDIVGGIDVNINKKLLYSPDENIHNENNEDNDEKNKIDNLEMKSIIQTTKNNHTIIEDIPLTNSKGDCVKHNTITDGLVDVIEVNFNLENLPEETIQLKKRNYIYYELYKEAKNKAKTARDLALSSYLEAKRIKNTYLLDEFESDESDLDENINNISN